MPYEVRRGQSDNCFGHIQRLNQFPSDVPVSQHNNLRIRRVLPSLNLPWRKTQSLSLEVDTKVDTRQFEVGCVGVAIWCPRPRHLLVIDKELPKVPLSFSNRWDF